MFFHTPKMNWLFQVISVAIYISLQASGRPPPSHFERPNPSSRGRPAISHRLSNKVNSILRHRGLESSPKLRTQDDLLNREGADSKAESKRGLNLGIHLVLPTTKKYDAELDRLEEMIEVLGGRLTGEKLTGNDSDCPSCEEEEEVVHKRLIPAYSCDDWDPKHRICILERNIGDTVTFYLSTGKAGDHRLPNVTWKKEFHMQDSAQEKKEFVIKPENPPENVIIGRRGYELRVSPITETDVEHNMFSATLATRPTSEGNNNGPPVTGKVYFMIRIVPVDLGFVYVGETIELNLRKFVSLPAQSMTFKWFMERDGERGTLPSNMKVSVTGSSIKISELRQEQEGILACSVYTNLRVQATKKRFRIKDLAKNRDVLQSSPSHTLVFKEEHRFERDPKRLAPVLSSLRLSRQKRDGNLDDMVEKALMELSSSTDRSIDDYTTVEVPTRSSNDYETMDHEEPQSFDSGVSQFHEVSDDFAKPQIDISVDGIPEEPVEGQYNHQNRRPMTDDLFSQADSGRASGKTKGYFQNKMHTPEGKMAPGHIRNGMPVGNADQEAFRNGIPHGKMAPGQQRLPHHQQNVEHDGKYVDQDVIEAKNEQPPFQQRNDFQEIVVNIDRMAEPRRVSAEEQIAQLISSCYSDFECSGSAVCARTSLKKAGYCKCLPGYYGVGIFCREEIWLSNSNFDLEEHSADYGAGPSGNKNDVA